MAGDREAEKSDRYDCRRLARLAAKPEDKQHFVEMAATWDMLAKQRPSESVS
jgi:hypothetical protein